MSISGVTYDENSIADIIKNNYSKITGKLGQERVDALYNSAIDDLIFKSYEKNLIDSSFEGLE